MIQNNGLYISATERDAFESLKIGADANNTTYYVGSNFDADTVPIPLQEGQSVDVSFDTLIVVDGEEPTIILNGKKHSRGFREGLQSALTSAQLAAVNSGITAERLSKLANKKILSCGIYYHNGRVRMGFDGVVTSSDFPMLAICQFYNENGSLYSNSSIDVDIYNNDIFIGTRRLAVDRGFFARFPENSIVSVLVYISESNIIPFGLEAVKDIYQLQKQPTWYVVHNTNEPDINEYFKKDAWKNILPKLKVGDLVIYLDKAYEVLDMDEDYEDEPEDPGEEPEEPVEPEEPDLEEPSLDDYEDEDEYQEALAEYQDAMSAYQEEYAEYESALATYQKEYEAWRIKSEAYDSFVPPITPNFNQVLNGGQSSANSLCSWKKYDAITGDNAYPNFISLVSGNTTAWQIDDDTLVGNIEIDATKGNRIFDFRNLKDANDEPIPVDFAVNIAGFTSYETIIFFKGIDTYSISPTSPLAMSNLCFCGEEPDLDTEKEYVLSIQGNTFIFGELSRGVDAETEEE